MEVLVIPDYCDQNCRSGCGDIAVPVYVSPGSTMTTSILGHLHASRTAPPPPRMPSAATQRPDEYAVICSRTVPQAGPRLHD